MNYDRYSKMFDNEDNFTDAQEENLNIRMQPNDEAQEKILKNNLEFTKNYYEKNRILLNKFTQDFQEEINVINLFIFFKIFYFIL